jgi:TetR/AcrR family transcriptional repressor of nem operon
MGRPRQFDEKRVLEAATEIFRAKGYGGASTRDLSEQTGLRPSSMYNEFGDKRGLYRRALEHYVERTLHERMAGHEAALPPGRAIAAFFKEVIDRSLADPGHRGCMLVNAALEATPDDPGLQRFVAEETDLIERFFHRCILAAQRTGEIWADHSADDVARMLLSVLLGLRVLARIRPDPELLSGLVRPAMAMLDIPWPPPEGRRAG